ncbi:integral membrane sensor signal transduction histidine kinase [Segniliparus rotundus DSM 44985]|uniref:Sensor histidine kinase MtrB n=1 Tax=Segniliparus rotundus (strain ATCC BAA-972 / CDC 1076 / CIP 108378 / DSM 44985 / JCM 13578) TaxID=640132 RepID=D6Z9Z3_SEGRD|nr:integral membrane sensor signal transduction histidine kinase [Segniliparus rotundus DSM 44985]
MIGGTRRLQHGPATFLTWLERASRFVGKRWRRSLQLRVLVSAMALSLALMLVLGFFLSSQIADRLLSQKIAAASDELARARTTVESELVGMGEAEGLESKMRAIRLRLSDPGSAAGLAGVFDSVIIVPESGKQGKVVLGPGQTVSEALQDFVRSGQVSYIYAKEPAPGGGTRPVLVMGTPMAVGAAGVQLYLIFPLSNEESTLNLVQRNLVMGGLVLSLLMAAVSMFVARQVVLPVRQTARIAVRFANGRLDERVPVRGEDDLARLAMSFNEMAESLSRQIVQLEEYGQLQRQFTSDVSHELRTPLTTVRLAADLIHGSRDELSPELARSSELLEAELDRFESLLTSLLEISRHDAGVADLSAEQVDLRRCVRAAVDIVEPMAKSTGTAIQLDLPDEPLIAEVDQRRVERVLRNLLANAVDHGDARPVQVKMRADTDAVAVTVRDWGVGLKPGEEKLVFNRFWRADPSRVRRMGGTGLGLAISYEDARLHQGRLEAWGEPGRGACFRLTLPLVRGHKVVGSPLPLKPASPQRIPSAHELREVLADSSATRGKGAE